MPTQNISNSFSSDSRFSSPFVLIKTERLAKASSGLSYSLVLPIFAVLFISSFCRLRSLAIDSFTLFRGARSLVLSQLPFESRCVKSCQARTLRFQLTFILTSLHREFRPLYVCGICTNPRWIFCSPSEALALTARSRFARKFYSQSLREKCWRQFLALLRRKVWKSVFETSNQLQ